MTFLEVKYFHAIRKNAGSKMTANKQRRISMIQARPLAATYEINLAVMFAKKLTIRQPSNKVSERITSAVSAVVAGAGIFATSPFAVADDIF